MINRFAKVNSIEEVLNQITGSIIETKNVSIKINNNQDSKALNVLNKLNNILENQVKDKKDYEELILEGSIHPKSSLFLNVYILLGKVMFEPIEPNTFVNIFQGHASSTKLKIKPKNVQNVYFLLSELFIQLKKSPLIKLLVRARYKFYRME